MPFFGDLFLNMSYDYSMLLREYIKMGVDD